VGDNQYLVTSQPVEFQNCLTESKIFGEQLIILGKKYKTFFIFLRSSQENAPKNHLVQENVGSQPVKLKFLSGLWTHSDFLWFPMLFQCPSKFVTKLQWNLFHLCQKKKKIFFFFLFSGGRSAVRLSAQNKFFFVNGRTGGRLGELK